MAVMHSLDSPEAPLTEGPRSNAGKWLVIAMFAFGFTTTGMVWVYWKLHLGPFMPLQKALAETFPKCRPRVEGGRHKGSPPVLRVAIHVTHPLNDEPWVEETLTKVLDVTKAYPPLKDYETLEIYLLRPLPERDPERIKREYRVSEVLAGGSPPSTGSGPGGSDADPSAPRLPPRD